MDLSTLYVVMPVHNRRALTERCLAALAEQTVRGFGVIVVDDGSTDGTAEMVASHFPEVEVMKRDGSLWWSGSVNLGVKHALSKGACAVLLVNDDTTPAPDFVEALACRGQCAARLSRFTEAVADFDAALALSPGPPDFRAEIQRARADAAARRAGQPIRFPRNLEDEAGQAA